MVTGNTWSVYVLTVPNGKKYIGTTNREPKRRWNYGYGYEKNQPFFAEIMEYGWDSIKKEIIASGLSQNDAHILEQELIKQHNSTDPMYGYNRAAGGIGTTGFYPSKESREKMAKSHIGIKNHCVPVYQFDGGGNLVASFASVKEASSITGIKYKSIINCCSGVTKQAGGYIWRHKIST